MTLAESSEVKIIVAFSSVKYLTHKAQCWNDSHFCIIVHRIKYITLFYKVLFELNIYMPEKPKHFPSSHRWLSDVSSRVSL